MTQYETFETWLNKYLMFELPPEVKAVNFNLYESSGGDDEFDVQLIGAPLYEHDNPDWACNAIFSTGEDLCSIKAVDWENCLQIVMEYIQKYLSFGTYAKKLKNLIAVTVGFVDGDLEIVLKN